jgi:hypothetical protein
MQQRRRHRACFNVEVFLSEGGGLITRRSFAGCVGGRASTRSDFARVSEEIGIHFFFFFFFLFLGDDLLVFKGDG